MKWVTVNRHETKKGFFECALLTIFLIAALLIADGRAYAQAIKLTLVSGWTSPAQGNVKLEEFVKRVNEKGKGKVFIDYKGGAEIAPITESPGLVRDGVFDIAHTTPGYYGGLCPEAVLMYYAPSDPSVLRKIGFNHLLDEVHRKKMGVTYLGTLWRGEKFIILSKNQLRVLIFPVGRCIPFLSIQLDSNILGHRRWPYPCQSFTRRWKEVWSMLFPFLWERFHST